MFVFRQVKLCLKCNEIVTSGLLCPVSIYIEANVYVTEVPFCNNGSWRKYCLQNDKGINTMLSEQRNNFHLDEKRTQFIYIFLCAQWTFYLNNVFLYVLMV